MGPKSKRSVFIGDTQRIFDRREEVNVKTEAETRVMWLQAEEAKNWKRQMDSLPELSDGVRSCQISDSGFWRTERLNHYCFKLKFVVISYGSHKNPI